MGIKIIEYSPAHFLQLQAFLSKWGGQHPELATTEKMLWQRRQLFLALSGNDNDIVGCIGQIPHMFYYGQKTAQYGAIEHIGWAITLVLDMSEDAIRKEAGRMLLSKCEKNPPLKYSGVGMVPTVESVYERRGHTIRRDCAYMFGRFSRPIKILNYLGKSIWLSPIFKMANFIMPRRSINRGFCRKIDKFESEWNIIWQRILEETYQLYGERNSDYLNYKLSQPGKEYIVNLFYSDEKSELPEGYIIYRLAKHETKDLRLIKICDYVGTIDAKVRLISEAIKFAYANESYGIVAIGGIEDKSLFRLLGLYVAKPYPIALSPTIKTKMHITFFDSDLDDLW